MVTAKHLLLFLALFFPGFLSAGPPANLTAGYLLENDTPPDIIDRLGVNNGVNYSAGFVTTPAPCDTTGSYMAGPFGGTGFIALPPAAMAMTGSLILSPR